MQVWFHRLARVATVLTFFVVVIGAWVRVTDAGLGCPDWPGCYGQLIVPQSEQGLARAELVRPDRAVDTGAAWREMIHRYLAGVLGLLVLGLAAIAVANRRDPQQPVALPLGIAGLIVFQSMLGMWTVTWLLKPVVVMAHLLGGLATLSLLFVLAYRSAPAARNSVPDRCSPATGLRRVATVALGVLIVQIALGGWVSANYAALACPDFPTCQTQWWPQGMDFREGFVFWRGLGVDYEFGVLDAAASTAVHMTHRLGAVVTALVLGGLAVAVFVRGDIERRVRGAAGLVLAALLAQLTIGALIVQWQLPMGLATAHNAMAALLLLAVIHLLRALDTVPARQPHRALEAYS